MPIVHNPNTPEKPRRSAGEIVGGAAALGAGLLAKNIRPKNPEAEKMAAFHASLFSKT